MSRIVVDHEPDETRLTQLGVRRWPVWERDVSTFPWEYFEDETSYIVAGRARVTPEGGATVEIGAGDLVRFESGLICKWQIVEPIRKHCRFG